jgi:ABC-type transporter lipoprotein component MlaA
MNLDEIDALKKQALDYYAMVRNGYLQHREALVTDAATEDNVVKDAEAEEDLYFFDFDEE